RFSAMRLPMRPSPANPKRFCISSPILFIDPPPCPDCSSTPPPILPHVGGRDRRQLVRLRYSSTPHPVPPHVRGGERGNTSSSASSAPRPFSALPGSPS